MQGDPRDYVCVNLQGRVGIHSVFFVRQVRIEYTPRVDFVKLLSTAECRGTSTAINGEPPVTLETARV